MNINTPITSVLKARELELGSTLSAIGNVKATFAEMQTMLLNGFESSTKASSISVTDFLTLASTSIGTVFDSQIKIIDNMSNHLRSTPNSLVTIQSARGVGTTTALMLLAYTELLSNPHKTISFVCPSKSMARGYVNMFERLVSSIQHDTDLPKIFARKLESSFVTPMNGRICFVTSIRGYNSSLVIVEHPDHFSESNKEELEDFLSVRESLRTDVIISTNGIPPKLVDNDTATLSLVRKWDENPNHDTDWYNKMKSVLPSPTFDVEVNL